MPRSSLTITGRRLNNEWAREYWKKPENRKRRTEQHRRYMDQPGKKERAAELRRASRARAREQ